MIKDQQINMELRDFDCNVRRMINDIEKSCYERILYDEEDTLIEDLKSLRERLYRQICLKCEFLNKCEIKKSYQKKKR